MIKVDPLSRSLSLSHSRLFPELLPHKAVQTAYCSKTMHAKDTPDEKKRRRRRRNKEERDEKKKKKKKKKNKKLLAVSTEIKTTPR